jgi:replicative DNA helicase
MTDTGYAADATWPDPAPVLDNSTLPPFPLEDAPITLRAIVESVAVMAQLDEAHPALIAAAVVGAACQGRVAVRMTDGWLEPVAVYATPVAKSGNIKSSALTKLAKPLDAIGAELHGAYEDELRSKRRDKERAKETLAKARADFRKGDISEADYDAAADAYDAIVLPFEPTLYATDATPEGLVRYLNENGERLSFISDEGGGFLTATGVRYASTAQLDPILKSWSGTPTIGLRSATQKIRLSKPLMNFGVLAQPDALHTIAAVPGATGRGLLDRLLVAAPADKLGHRDVDPPDVPPHVARDWENLIVRLTRVTRPLTEWVEIPTTSAALELVQEWRRREVEPRMADDAEWDTEALRGYAAKLHGHAVRLAAVHHIARWPIRGPRDRPWDEPLSEASMAWGTKVAMWSVPHHAFALADAGADAAVADVARVQRWLQNPKRRHEEDRFTVTRRSAMRGTGLKDADVTEAALRRLADLGWLREAVDGADAERRPGRQPLPRWEVHPWCR